MNNYFPSKKPFEDDFKWLFYREFFRIKEKHSIFAKND